MLPECLLKPNWPGLPEQFGAYTTTRQSGVSFAPYDDGSGAHGFNLATHVGDQPEAVDANRLRLNSFLPAQPQWLTQVHGASVANLDDPTTGLEADAVMSTRVGAVCAVMTADCLPVLFCDPVNGVVAAAHAGWRGLAAGVLENTVTQRCRAGARVEQILAWLGPAIGPEQFEVGAEVRAQFVASAPADANAFALCGVEKFHANIYQLARRRLQACGLVSIEGGEYCTVTQRRQFYSYRRDGVTGRMASLIWVK